MITRLREKFVKRVSRFDDDVDAFLDAVNVYKECVAFQLLMRSEDFLLITGNAATWWQGIKDSVQSWAEVSTLLEGDYGLRKPNFAFLHDLVAEKQDQETLTEFFVNKARAQLSRLTEKPSEALQIDMVYGLLHRKIRK